MKRTHLLWSYIWNWTLDGRYKWICKLFWHTKLMEFEDGSSITAKDLWEARKNQKS